LAETDNYLKMENGAKFEEIAILGLGLLGGSIARAAKEQGLVERVVGFGRTEKRLRYALDNGIADRVARTPEEAARGADLVIVCTPVGLIPGIIDSIAPHVKDGAIVPDVGSTKTEIVSRAERALSPRVNFIGGPPMAGAEESGIEASTATLFENALCVLTSSSGTNISALNRLERFWEKFRARVMIVSPEEHDLLVAASSHLAHIAAVSLTRCVNDISKDHEKVIPLLAGGFRDTTRVASGSPEMWRDICIDNKDRILAVIERFSRSIDEIAELVRGGDEGNLTKLFSDAKHFRDELSARSRGILEPENELLVDVADRPGVIGEIATSLGAAHINIRNINVQHVREFKGGTLSIILEKSSDIGPAVELLKSLGFHAAAPD
jgi:prephenate dehydrogenase